MVIKSIDSESHFNKWVRQYFPITVSRHLSKEQIILIEFFKAVQHFFSFFFFLSPPPCVTAKSSSSVLQGRRASWAVSDSPFPFRFLPNGNWKCDISQALNLLMVSYFALPQHPIKLFAKHEDRDKGQSVNRAFCFLFPHLAPLQELPHPGFIMPVEDKMQAVLLNSLWRAEQGQSLIPCPSAVLCDPNKQPVVCLHLDLKPFL